jgi:hypothetical protein
MFRIFTNKVNYGKKNFESMFYLFLCNCRFFGAISLYLILYSIINNKETNDDSEGLAGALVVMFIGITFIYHLAFLFWSKGLLKQKDTYTIYCKIRIAIIFFAGVCLPIYAVLNLFIL